MVNYFLLLKTRRKKSTQPSEGEAASKCWRRRDHRVFYSAPEAATSDWVSVIPPPSSSPLLVRPRLHVDVQAILKQESFCNR